MKNKNVKHEIKYKEYFKNKKTPWPDSAGRSSIHPIVEM